ncbi:hypothetical protein PENSPDRAFT_748275 [Peniophora sp. CONT]|nr:hypothetical protein PENSPDRAFT_748275 [Peniophora sp. CONT]
MDGKDTQDNKGAQADMEAYFSKSSERVRYAFGRAEEQYVTPFLSFYMEAFSQRPVITTFVTVFTALSFWPIVTFIGWVIGGFAVILGIGVCVALALYAVLFVLAAGTLLAILVLLIVASVFITAGVLIAFATGYLTRRFYKLVRAQGREGVGAWVRETVELVTPANRSSETSKDEGSDDSAVVVN